MADSRGSGGKKGAAPVEIIHFPKRGARKSNRALGQLRGSRITLPDFTPDDEPPEGFDTPVMVPATPGAGRRQRASSRTEGARSRGGKRRASDGSDPVRQKAEQIQELLGRSGAPAGPVSRTQIAEMSLFGHHLFEQGQVDESRAVFEKIVGMGVEEAFPHTMLGTIYLAQGDSDRALALFEAALALDEADLAARVYRAEIRMSAGRIEDALADLDTAIGQGPGDDPFVDRAKRLRQMAEAKARRQRR